MAVQTFSPGFSGTERQDDNRGRLVTCHAEELRPHPSYIRHSLAVHACQLSAVAELGDLAFREPLVITQDHIILDGFARWSLARLQGRSTLACIEYEMSEAEALQNILQRHRRSSGLNDFMRICLGLELEPFLKLKGRAKQQAGGQNKGSSILTEAGRLDVRKEIARIAGVSVGNVTKVKQLTTTAHFEIIKALRGKELSIHRAWLWRKLSPDEQREKLWLNQSKRGIGKTIRHLLSPHLSKSSPTALNVGDLIKLVPALQSGKLGSVRLVSINVPGKIVFVTEELYRTLEAQEELALTCATNNP
ncbi:MAG: hypothetical protein WB711_21935 [Terriglobales bacterium]